MIVLYDYLLFALELAGILYFMRGLPLREMGESEAVQRLFRSALLTVMPLLLALRSGLDGLQADQYGPFRLTELFGLLYVFVRLRYCISSRETLYYTFILFLVEIAVEKAAAAFALSREGMNLANHAVLLEYPVEATVYLLLPAGLTFGVLFLLKRFCIRVQPKQIGWRELVPMALSMVPVLTVGYLIEALESGHGTGVPDTLGLFLYELCSLTSVLVMIGVDNVAFMREEAQSARMLEAVMRMQANQYDQRRRAMDEIQRKHHDLKHHLLYIARLESEGERIAYANEALETSFGEEQFLQTGNEVLDTVLSLSAQRCRDLDIRLVLFVDAQCMDFMRPGDIVAIASNALDNAVEAQMRLPEQVAREIMVRIHGDEHWLHLHFENTFAGEIKWRDGLPATNKENAQGHGLGLKSIRAAIERYEGTLQIEARDGRFALNILIPREMAGSSN